MTVRFVPSSSVRTAPRRGLWFAFRGNELLVDQTLAVLHIDDLGAFGLEAVRIQYLGELGTVACFSAELAPTSAAPQGTQFVSLFGLLGRMTDSMIALAGRALQIMEWDRTHQFCGACGSPTDTHEKLRARVCPRCKVDLYPRIAPAMIVAVERGDQILLARSPGFPPGIYSTLAGFVDPGESVEEAVHREVHEEVGVHIKNLRYFGSQPWPFPHSLMLGFQADYESGEITLDPIEIEDAGFFHVHALPRTFPGRVSISQWLLHDFCRRHGRDL